MPSRPALRLITLLTDFGLQDHFVGVMKGVIASIAPEARVIDISHAVPPQQIAPARFLLDQTWPYFPKKTIHVAVVDPGVGSARRALLVEAHGQFFIAPDNGILTSFLHVSGAKTREITNSKLFLPSVSATFHGRDVFSPVAAHLAAGVPPSRVGPRIEDAFRLSSGEPQRVSKRVWHGEVAYVDRFGNLITNFDLTLFPDLATRAFVLRVGMVEIEDLAPNYASGKAGEPLALIGSHGRIEVSVNQQSAEKRLGVGLGAPVELEFYS